MKSFNMVTRNTDAGRTTRQAAAALLGLLALTGCNLAPSFLKPAVPLPSSFKRSGPWRTATPRDEAKRGSWWSSFGDARLSSLMKQAEANSPTLGLEMHRVTEAQAVARADRANLFPLLTLNSSAQRSRGSGNLQFQFAGGRTRTILGTGLDLSYELDFWGRLRNQSRAGSERAEAAEANRNTAQLGLQSELAMN